MFIGGITDFVSKLGYDFLRYSMQYGIWRVVEGEKGWLMKLPLYWSIITLSKICEHQNVYCKLTCLEISACRSHVHLSCYPLYAHSSCFTFIEGSLCTEYNVGCFYAYPYVITTCQYGSSHIRTLHWISQSYGLCMQTAWVLTLRCSLLGPYFTLFLLLFDPFFKFVLC